jgi:hypothetical protein
MITNLPSRDRVWLFAAVALLLVAAGLRLHHLGTQSFWNDEGNAYVQALRTAPDIWDNAARDIHPPGYYALLAGWRLVVGENETALRFLSTLASLISIAFTYALGKRLFASGVGFAAALLVALNTFNIYYAQEARMYALLAMWAAIGMWAFIGFARRPGWRWGLALALANAAGLWTQYAYAFVMIAQGVLMLIWLVAELRRHGLATFAWALGNYVITSLLTIALYVPWLPIAFAQITSWPSTGDPVPLGEALNVVLGWLLFGITYAYTAPGSYAIALFLLLFGLFALPNRSRGWWATLVPVGWVLVTLAVFFGFQLLRPQNLKLLIPAQIAAALWLARGLWVLWTLAEHEHIMQPLRGFQRSAIRATLFRVAAAAGGAWLIFNLIAGLAPLHEDPAFQRADYRGIARDITSAVRDGDAIVLDAPNQQEVFNYYYEGPAPVYALPPGLGGDDEATRAAVREIIAAHDRAFVVFWGEAERDPNRVVETTLDSEAFEVGDTWYGDVRLSRYVMPAVFPAPTDSGARFGDSITLLSYALNSAMVAAGDVLQIHLNWSTAAPLDTRYKVFVQLLDEDGVLVAQRDSEPGGGLALTTTWTPGQVVGDNHGLRIPDDLPPAHYLLIMGLYDINQPTARLYVGDSDALTLAEIDVTDPSGETS